MDQGKGRNSLDQARGADARQALPCSDGKRDHALVGSSNFTLKGLGLSDEPNIELNLIVDSDRDRDDLLAWFNELWSDEELPPGGIMQSCERATGDCPPT